MRRGLPRLYKWDERHVWKIKSHFDDLEIIKKRKVEKEELKTYAQRKLPDNASIVLFTWIMEDGWGDFYTQLEVSKILKNAFPLLPIILISLIHKDKSVPLIPQKNHFIFKYKGNERKNIIYEEFSNEASNAIKQASVILQIPTFFPHTEKILQKMEKINHELIGECGFIDSAWFHPKTTAHCMGLHFLEKGILIKKIEKRSVIPCFNLDYTKTKRGHYMFLHIILKALEKDNRDITIASFCLNLYIDYLERGLKVLLKKFGIRELVFYFNDSICPVFINSEGKRLIVKLLNHQSQETFLKLFAETDQLVGCTGDGSISEALSLGKTFFYDPPLHKRNFLKDLIALAEERLQNYPETILFLKLTLKNPHLILEDVIDGWVTEEFLLIESEKTSAEDNRDETIADKMGELLQYSRTKKGFERLGEIVRKEYSINETLCHITAKAIISSQSKTSTS